MKKKDIIIISSLVVIIIIMSLLLYYKLTSKSDAPEVYPADIIDNMKKVKNVTIGVNREIEQVDLINGLYITYDKVIDKDSIDKYIINKDNKYIGFIRNNNMTYDIKDDYKPIFYNIMDILNNLKTYNKISKEWTDDEHRVTITMKDDKLPEEVKVIIDGRTNTYSFSNYNKTNVEIPYDYLAEIDKHLNKN